jgi:hypothetical protein
MASVESVTICGLPNTYVLLSKTIIDQDKQEEKVSGYFAKLEKKKSLRY